MFDVIRAWKDEDYRLSLSEEDRPECPVGEFELTDADLEGVYGGHFSGCYVSACSDCFGSQCHNASGCAGVSNCFYER